MKTRILAVLLSAFGLMHCASAANFDVRYTPRVGDLNADGKQDIYLGFRPKFAMIALDDMSVPIPTSKREVGEFVLQQNASGGGFTLLSQLSSAQLSSVRQWQKSNITALLGDYNVDGNQDIVLKGVAQQIPGGLDTFVFAPAQSGGAPLAVKGQDAEFQTFVRDVEGWLNDPTHFDSGIRVQTSTGYFRVAYFSCGGEVYAAWADDPNIAVCFQGCGYLGWQWVYGQLTVRTFDPTGFSVEAINLLNLLLPYLNDATLTPTAADARSIRDIISAALGAPYWPSSGTVDIPMPDASDAMEALKRFLRILARAGRAGGIIGGILTPSEVADGTLTEEQIAELEQELISQAIAVASVAQPGFLRLYHGTRAVNATALLAGAPLSVEAARANRTFTGDILGFYLATNIEVAEHWGAVAAKGGPYGVLQYTLTMTAHDTLRGAGSKWRWVPPITPHQSSAGYELVVPARAFPVFDGLRLTGQISVTAAN